MSTTSPVASHVAKLFSQGTQNSSEEDLPSSSISDEETHFLGQEEEKEDVEKAKTLAPNNEKIHEGRTRFLVWIVVNTLATIGIVRVRHGQTYFILTERGVHEQGHLRRPQAPAEPVNIRRFPLHHHRADFVCCLKTIYQHVHTISSELRQHDTIEPCNVFECGLAEPLISILLRRILPDRPRIADAIYRNH